MATRALWSFVVIILVCFAMSDDALSADVAVVYSIDSSETNGETVQGTMTVQVLNLTGGDLRNVDLRLAQGGGVIGRGVLQVGHLGAAQAAAASGGFHLDQGLFGESEALLFRVDFDDGAGNHHSVVIGAARAN